MKMYEEDSENTLRARQEMKESSFQIEERDDENKPSHLFEDRYHPGAN